MKGDSFDVSHDHFVEIGHGAELVARPKSAHPDWLNDDLQQVINEKAVLAAQRKAQIAEHQVEKLMGENADLWNRLHQAALDSKASTNKAILIVGFLGVIGTVLAAVLPILAAILLR